MTKSIQSMRPSLGWAIWGSAFLLSGCFREIDIKKVQCTPQDKCPSGYTCYVPSAGAVVGKCCPANNPTCANDAGIFDAISSDRPQLSEGDMRSDVPAADRSASPLDVLGVSRDGGGFESSGTDGSSRDGQAVFADVANQSPDGTVALPDAKLSSANEVSPPVDVPTLPLDGPFVDAAGKAKNGEACLIDGDCADNHCVDKICCDQPCQDPCFACKQALTGGAQGSCAPVSKGKDPYDHCALEPTNECGNDGFCDGTGACAKVGSDHVCKTSKCTGSLLTPAATCDGKGTCAQATPRACDGNLVCAVDAIVCKAVCALDADCTSGFYCASGACRAKKSDGQACAVPPECQSGICASNCCIVACQNAGTCKTDGTCDCKPGFAGTACQTNVDDCASAPCKNGGTCNDGVASYTCTCAAGWTGADCALAVFRGLGVLSAGGESWANAVSADGSVVVGDSSGTGKREAFQWKASTGMQVLATPTDAVNFGAEAVSENGLSVAGWAIPNTFTTRGIVWINGVVSNQYHGNDQNGVPRSVHLSAVSADGSIVAGTINTFGDVTVAARWTSRGQNQTLLVPGYNLSYVKGMTPDGSVVVGYGEDEVNSMIFAYRWSAATGSFSFLPVPVGGASAPHANAVNPDGTVIVGSNDSLAVRWVGSGVATSLGIQGAANAVNTDATVIVGSSTGGAFVWRQGTVSFLRDLLVAAGANLTGWTLSSATGISGNGKVVVGQGTFNGLTQAFIARLP